MTDLKKTTQEQEKKQRLFMSAFSFVSEFGFVIALPLIGLGLLGRWLDRTHHTSYFVLLGILLSLTVSTVWIGKRISTLRKDLKQ